MTYFRSFTENMTFFPISLLLLQRFVRECSSLQSVRWRQKIGKQTAAGVFPCRCRFYQLICLFAAVQSVQERDDLCSRAVVMRTEQTVSDAAGDALLLCPCCRIGVVCIGRYIGEGRTAADCRTACRTVQERCALCSREDGAGCKRCIARALGNAILNCPCNRLSVVCICRNIREAAQRLRFRRTRRAPQECYDLCSGAGSVRSEQRVAHTAGNGPSAPPRGLRHSSNPPRERR